MNPLIQSLKVAEAYAGSALVLAEFGTEPDRLLYLIESAERALSEARAVLRDTEEVRP